MLKLKQNRIGNRAGRLSDKVPCSHPTLIWEDPKAITIKNVRLVTQGTYPICGAEVFRIGKSWIRYHIMDDINHD